MKELATCANQDTRLASCTARRSAEEVQITNEHLFQTARTGYRRSGDRWVSVRAIASIYAHCRA